MADNSAMRTCRKTACRWPAVASLSYRYDTRQVWLLDLADDPDPSLYDLCPHHADALVVPQGWDRVDQRTYTDPVVEPAGRDLVRAPERTAEASREPVAVGAYGSSRYALLSQDLPRLAREVAAQERAEARAEARAQPQPAAEPEDETAEDAATAENAATDEEPATAEEPPPPAPRHAAPVPSRDLAPVPTAHVPRAESGSIADDSGDAHEDDASTTADSSRLDSAGPDQLPGQLAIPVPDVQEAIGEAVVVSIEHANSRRRAAEADMLNP
jgi:hypothetical protein